MSDQFGFNQQQYQPPTQPPPYQVTGSGYTPGIKPKPSGCGPTGCLIGCLALILIMIIIGVGGVFYARHWVKNTILEDTQMEVKMTQPTPEQLAALQAKVAPIKEAFENDTGEEIELVLTQEEVNWYIILAGQLEEMPGGSETKVALQFPRDGVAEFKLSLSLNQGDSEGKGGGGPPYINIEGRSGIAISDGKPDIKIEIFRIGKFVLPEAFFSEANKALGEQMQNDPQGRIFLDRVRDLRIEGGQIHFKLRAMKWPEQTTSSSNNE